MGAARAAIAFFGASFPTCYGKEFADRKKDCYAMSHAFGIACAEPGIEHRLTIVNHPWTHDEVEWMSRTVKDATVKRSPYGSHDPLCTDNADVFAAYTYARRLKTRRGLTPHEHVVTCWT